MFYQREGEKSMRKGRRGREELGERGGEKRERKR